MEVRRRHRQDHLFFRITSLRLVSQSHPLRSFIDQTPRGFRLLLGSSRYLIGQGYYNHRSKSSLSTRMTSDPDPMGFRFSTETQSDQTQERPTSSGHQRRSEFSSEETQRAMEEIAARHDHSRRAALLSFADETHDNSTNTHSSELDPKVILNQIPSSIFSKQTFLLPSPISENRTQKPLSTLKRSMRQKARDRRIYNLNRSRLHLLVALKAEEPNYDKKKLLRLRKNETQMRTKDISILSLDQLTDLIDLDLISPHMRILETAARTPASIFENEPQGTTGAQVGNTTEANKPAVKTEMVPVTPKKAPAASAVGAPSSDHLSTPPANATGAANILQTDQNLNPNPIEASSTSLNSNVTLDPNLDPTPPSQPRTLTEEIQHRKKIKERLQQQKEAQPESESTVDTSAIESFGSESMALYETPDPYEKTLTSTIRTELS